MVVNKPILAGSTSLGASYSAFAFAIPGVGTGSITPAVRSASGIRAATVAFRSRSWRSFTIRTYLTYHAQYAAQTNSASYMIASAHFPTRSGESNEQFHLINKSHRDTNVVHPVEFRRVHHLSAKNASYYRGQPFPSPVVQGSDMRISPSELRYSNHQSCMINSVIQSQ